MRTSKSVTTLRTPSLLGLLLLTGALFANAQSLPFPGPGGVAGGGAGSPSTPTLVQTTASGRENTVTSPPQSLIANLPNPSLSGNAIICGVEYDGSMTVGTVTDNKSNTWTRGAVVTTGGQGVSIYYALNATTGTQKITFPFTSTGNIDSISGVCSEYAGVQTSGSIGPTGVNSGTAKSINLSSAPTSGDLVWMWGTDITTLTPNLTSITAGTNFRLLSANREAGQVAQDSITTSSRTAAFTTSGSNTWNVAAITLHAAAAGTAGSGLRVVCQQFEFYGVTTHTMQFPCPGINLAVMVWASQAQTVTAITDSANTWNLGNTVNPGTGAVGQIAYAASYSPGTTVTIAPTYATGGIGLNSIKIFGIAGATSSPYVTSGTASGNQTTNVGSLTASTVTPTSTNSLIINMTTITDQTVNGVSADTNGHTPYLTQWVNTGDSNGGGSQGTSASTLAEDDGTGVFYNGSSTTAMTFIYTLNSVATPAGAGQWAAISSVFK